MDEMEDVVVENGFKKLGLSETTIEALIKKGFEEPTPIQAKTIPILLSSDLDIIGQAQTGTGKTAAFGLPFIELLKENARCVQALVLVPTRELALQVAEEINSLKGSKRLHIYPIYGGQSMDLQLRRLRSGVDVVVGTPGRIIDHLGRGNLDLSKLSHVVLDEADEMLNMGFIDDVEDILKHAPPERRMLLFSATMPERIMSLAKRHMKKYEYIAIKKDQLTTNLTDQIYFEVSESDKFEALCRIIDVESEFYGLIFCRTKVDVDQVAHKLMDRGYDAEAMHGDMSQAHREKIMDGFRKQRLNIVVATDVAARGIDISNLTHVINYSLPQDPEAYVHRIGRTGRAGREGTAITFVTPSEYRNLAFIKRVAKTEIRKEKLPKVEDVINIRRSRLLGEIQAVLDEGDLDTYREMAASLLLDMDPVDIVSAILKHGFSRDLDESSYAEIREASVEHSGKTRLFVALGRIDSMTPPKLVEYIERETSVHGRAIRDVRIFDNFSFITTSFEDAEIIMEAFKRNRKGGRRPLVERARENNAPSGR